MIISDLVELAWAGLFFTVGVLDIVMGSLLLITNRRPLLPAARLTFWLVQLLPSPIRERRLERARQSYGQRHRIYGALALLAGPMEILLGGAILWSLSG